MEVRKLVVEDTYYLGASDRRLALFENVYPLNNGISYNSYLIVDEKTCLMDSVDKSIDEIFYEKLEKALEGRKLDYVVVNHMECDHSYSLNMVLDMHPEATLIINDKALKMFKNFCDGEEPKKYQLVKDGETLSLGKHTLTFIFAPMVHWPEVMVSYDSYTKTLFSADAFGTFNALSGNIFADEVDFENDFLEEARRYYTNIVGKYGPQVQSLLKKASGITIENLCPLHGPVWRKDLSYIIGKYDKWSRYESERNGVLIVYGSVYGHSEYAANLIAENLASKGLTNIHMFDASKTDKSYLVSETFKYSHIVICSSTYNMGIFTPMEEFLLDLKYHNMQNRKYAIIENGTRCPNSGKLIKEIMSSMKNMTQIGSTITLASAYHSNQEKDFDNLISLIMNDFPIKKENSNPLLSIPYGLFVLTSNDGTKDDGCIINTVNQVASNPDKLMISINKANYSSEVVLKTLKCNLSYLTIYTPFALIKNFGFQSGRTIDKFISFASVSRSKNGLLYLNKYTNNYLSLKVDETIDLKSHYGFICSIEEEKTLSKDETLSYDFYQKNIKPAFRKEETSKKGWICKICGYIYEGEVLPKDFICPICKHGANDFERIK